MKDQLMADELIINKIYFVRGQKVMLDEDLAELYQVTTGNLNKAVARNIKRFPDDFMFRLTDEEFKNLLFQNGIASWSGRRQAPNCFSEQGVAMLSGILSSDRAIHVNIQIMRIFTRTQPAEHFSQMMFSRFSCSISVLILNRTYLLDTMFLILPIDQFYIQLIFNSPFCSFLFQLFSSLLFIHISR